MLNAGKNQDLFSAPDFPFAVPKVIKTGDFVSSVSWFYSNTGVPGLFWEKAMKEEFQQGTFSIPAVGVAKVAVGEELQEVLMVSAPPMGRTVGP